MIPLDDCTNPKDKQDTRFDLYLRIFICERMLKNGVKNGASLDLNPKVRISPKYEIGYRNLIW